MIAARRIWTIVYIGLAVVGFIAAFLLVHIPHGPEHWSADLLTAWLSKRYESQHPKVAIIEVTDQTLEGLPYSSPIDRLLIGKLIAAVDDAGATAIGIDIIFDRATEPAKDEALIRLLKGTRTPIVLGVLGSSSLVTKGAQDFQADFVARSGRPAGFVYFEAHHNPLVISDDAVRFAISYDASQPIQPGIFAQMLAQKAGVRKFPSSNYIAWLLEPKDETQTFMTLPAERIMDQGGSSQALPLKELLGGKVILIGGNFPSRDQHLTPLSVWSGERYSGVFIHAQVLAQSIDGRSIRALDRPIQLLLSVLALLGGFFIGRTERARHYHPWFEIATFIVLIGVGILAFWIFKFVFPFISLVIGWGSGIAAGHASRRLAEE
jgi:adenylate cyclase